MLNGGLGDDTFNYIFGDGADAIDGGGGTDTLNITGTTTNNTLNVMFDGAGLTQFEGGTLANIDWSMPTY